VPPPNGFDAVLVEPKPVVAGGLAPNKLLPVFEPNAGVVVVLAFEPNPPKPVLPDVAVLFPNKPPVVLGAAPPKAFGLEPNAVF
jgi:hypothetical protein